MTEKPAASISTELLNYLGRLEDSHSSEVKK